MGVSDPTDGLQSAAQSGSSGRVVRVNGPLVEVEGLEKVAMLDVVAIGHAGLAAEVVSVRVASSPLKSTSTRVGSKSATQPLGWVGRSRLVSARVCSGGSSTACFVR